MYRHDSFVLAGRFWNWCAVRVQFVAVSDLPVAEYFPVVSFYNEYEKAVDWIDLTSE
jgi:hypothetical protein